MTEALRWVLRAGLYALFFAGIALLSVWPRYDYAPADKAEIKLSLSHAAERVEPCVRLTPQQIADLPPNMRRTEDCERQRLPLTIELDVDDVTVLSMDAAPSGVWEDGPASVYERFTIAAGPHRVAVRMRDSARTDGWDYAFEDDVDLQPGRYFTITFKAETGGFRFR